VRILLIPIEKASEEVKTGDWHATIFHLLSRKHRIIGVVRPRWHSMAHKGMKKDVLLAYYWLKSFVFGITHSGRYDLIYCINTPSALVGLLLSLFSGKPFVWDAGNPSLFNPGPLSQPFFMLEKIIARKAKWVRMISREYRDRYMAEGFSGKKMVIIPHLVNLDSIERAYADKVVLRRKLGLGVGERILMFIGQGSTPFNLEAIRWLNDELAPLVKGKIIVAGANTIPARYPNLVFIGYVPDIYEYIYACDAAVVPIWKSSGAPVPSTRTIDFMSCAKPVVVTDFLLEVIPELVDGENIYIAKIEGEFKRKVLCILENPADADRMGRNARGLVESEYSWSAGIEKLEGLLSDNIPAEGIIEKAERK